jgi:hypothetical protein
VRLSKSSRDDPEELIVTISSFLKVISNFSNRNLRCAIVCHEKTICLHQDENSVILNDIGDFFPSSSCRERMGEEMRRGWPDNDPMWLDLDSEEAIDLSLTLSLELRR